MPSGLMLGTALSGGKQLPASERFDQLSPMDGEGGWEVMGR